MQFALDMPCYVLLPGWSHQMSYEYLFHLISFALSFWSIILEANVTEKKKSGESMKSPHMEDFHPKLRNVLTLS